MIDHAQAKIRMMDAAIRVAEQVDSKFGLPLGNAEVACLNQLKRAVLDFKETKQAKPIGDDDSFHGCG